METQIKTIQITEDDHGDAILDLGEELCSQLGWKIWDTLKFTPNEDGSITISKVKENK